MNDPLSLAATFILRGLLVQCGSVVVHVRGVEKIPLGCVDGVAIEGQQWCSPGGLSCRSIDFAVGPAEIDAGALFSSRRITFQRPAKGVANVAFNSVDFSNFLMHPLVYASAANSYGLSFPGPNSIVEAGGVVFEGYWRGQMTRSMLLSSPTSPGGFAITGDAETVMSMWLSELRVDLDGAIVGPVRAVRISTPLGIGSSEWTVNLELDLTVRRFPSLPPKF
mmetsp:Transcript_37615/g.62287  ORF Transcript_37615/g.62287 Transcript_37615/m.62287 type:complete len:222 (-) Transcript_37615:43-708(-)